MTRLIYVVGPPGSGKSTLMAELTREWSRVPTSDMGLPRDLLYDGEAPVGVELGRRRGQFSGTDALAMNIHPLACAWMRAAADPLVFGEGQRLGTRGFLSAAVDAGRAVDLVWLDPPEDVCRGRRESRGSTQSPQWVRASTTRAARLAEAASQMSGVRVTRVPTHGSAREAADRLRHELRLEVPA